MRGLVKLGCRGSPVIVRNPMKLSTVVPTFLIACALFGGCSPAPETAEPRAATVLPAPQPLPDFRLVDVNGTEQSRAVFEGGWNLLFFGFTSCPDVCPTTLATLNTAVNELASNASASLPGIVLVSVDPARDTPEKLGEYVAYFGDANKGLTGSEAELRALTEPLGIYFRNVETGDGNYTVDHSAAVLLINPDAEFAALFSGPHQVEDLVHDLRIIMESS